eukprot:TRINITY_DN8146_c0_g1_i1.p1 TRINITY_DN8146_c0_g1~~TRINITY_DN8146_c0_g1_i1.p1  ORF type:complete len:293 (+),score=61.73 TRINITY_DN8146_c0_g1_i1:43-921(+)
MYADNLFQFDNPYALFHLWEELPDVEYGMGNAEMPSDMYFDYFFDKEGYTDTFPYFFEDAEVDRVITSPQKDSFPVLREGMIFPLGQEGNCKLNPPLVPLVLGVPAPILDPLSKSSTTDLLQDNTRKENDHKFCSKAERKNSSKENKTCQAKKRPRVHENDIDFTEFGLPEGFRLSVCKSPIMDALAFCAVKSWGMKVEQCSEKLVVFKVFDFDMYYKFSRAICSKQNPTEDVGARVKALRRWFVDYPRKKFRNENPEFELEVKPDYTPRVYEMIKRHRSLLQDINKRRRLK